MTSARDGSASDSVETLDEDACRALLESQTLGRVAFENGQFPMVLPVNYACVGDLIVFRTDAGTKLENVPMCPVAFEIDCVSDQTASSVVVLGHARELTTALGPKYDALRHLDIALVAPGTKGHWIGIEMQQITGRRFAMRNR